MFISHRLILNSNHNRQTAQDEKRRLESLLSEMEEEREEAEAQCEITEDRNRKLQVINLFCVCYFVNGNILVRYIISTLKILSSEVLKCY